MKSWSIPKPIKDVAHTQEQFLQSIGDANSQVHVFVKGSLEQRHEHMLADCASFYKQQDQSVRLSMQFHVSDTGVSVSPCSPQRPAFHKLAESADLSTEQVSEAMTAPRFQSIKHPYGLSVDGMTTKELVIPVAMRLHSPVLLNNSMELCRPREIQSTLNFLQTVNSAKDNVGGHEFNLKYEEENKKNEVKIKPSFNTTDFKIISPDSLVNTVEMHLFIPAFEFLKDMFKGSIRTNSISNFCPASLIIIHSVLEKKFEIELTTDQAGLAKLEQLVANDVFRRRPEECKKMVFGYAIKQLKRRLRDSLNCRYRKNGFEEFFYTHYFGEAAAKEGLPIADFYYPIVSEKKKMGSARTINKAYISNIKKSDAFAADFEEYLNVFFVDDYCKEIDNKIFDLMSKWESIYKTSLGPDQWQQNMQAQLGLSKSKLPWTIGEIKTAIDRVKKIMF